MNLRRTWSTPGLVLGLVMMSLGAAAFTEPALPVPLGVQAESPWTQYQRTIQRDQRTVTQNRNRSYPTLSDGAARSPRTRDHRTSLPEWLAVALIGLVIILVTGTIFAAKRRRQKQENTLNRRIFPL